MLPPDEIFADRPQQAVVLAQASEVRHVAFLLPLYRARIGRCHDVAVAVEHDRPVPDLPTSRLDKNCDSRDRSMTTLTTAINRSSTVSGVRDADGLPVAAGKIG